MISASCSYGWLLGLEWYPEKIVAGDISTGGSKECVLQRYVGRIRAFRDFTCEIHGVLVVT